MDIEKLVIRLEQLNENDKVHSYLTLRDWGLSTNHLYEDENTKEYEEIEEKLKIDLSEEINNRSADVFVNIDYNDFSLFEIRQQLNLLAHDHWQARNEIEIKRDSLLHLPYTFYPNSYEQVNKYKQLQEIDITRKRIKEEVIQIIITDLKTIFIGELSSNKLQGVLQKLNDYYYAYLKERANAYFETRDIETKERDDFGYINVETYENCFITSLQQAIEFIQSTSKDETIELYNNYLRNKIIENNTEEYWNIDSDLYKYASSLFENRSQAKIEDDNFRLIKLKTYLNWRHPAIKQIETEFPEKFAKDEDDYEDYGEYDDYERTPDSRYEKYGGYNGFDDDTIDSAFEGDPENTWNVD